MESRNTSILDLVDDLLETTNENLGISIESNDEPDEERIVKVEAFERSRSLYTIDKEGQKVRVATATHRDYEQDRRVRHTTMQNDHNLIHLGNTRDVWNLVDHYQVAEPLLKAGFTNVQLLNHRGYGAQMQAVLSNPDLTYKDVIGWDSALFPNGDPNSELQLAASINTTLRPGQSIKVTFGFFRILCQNGLISNVLDMGHQYFNHGNFFADKNGEENGPRWIRETSEILADQLSDGNILELPSLKPRIDSQALDWGIEVLKRSTEDETYIQNLPDFARKPFDRLIRHLPARGAYVLQESLQQAKNAGDVGLLDILSILTNVASSEFRPLPGSDQSQRRFGRPSFEVYGSVEPMLSDLRAIVEIGAFRKDLAWSE